MNIIDRSDDLPESSFAKTTEMARQLSVPVIALAAGVLLLGEALSLRLLLGGVLTLGGILIALRAAR